MSRKLINDAIKAALLIIHSRYNEKLTVEQISEAIFFSPFYFSRAFHKATGIAPSQYLKALRLFEAKRLLMTTSLTVADVVTAVGYSSVGTFTSRFVRETGMTPTQLRDPEVRNLLIAVGPGFCQMPSCDLAMTVQRFRPASGQPTGSILGRIQMLDATPADVLICVFDSIVPQREPIACQVLRRAGSADVLIENVPTGRWFVIAMAAPSPAGPDSETHILGISRAVSVGAGRTATTNVAMHSPTMIDPPIVTMIAPPPCRTPAVIAPRDGHSPRADHRMGAGVAHLVTPATFHCPPDRSTSHTLSPPRFATAGDPSETAR